MAARWKNNKWEERREEVSENIGNGWEKGRIRWKYKERVVRGGRNPCGIEMLDCDWWTTSGGAAKHTLLP